MRTACRRAVLACSALVLLAAAPAGNAPAQLDFAFSAGQIATSCAQAIADYRARIAAVVALPAQRRDFSSVVAALEDAGARTGERLAAQTFLYAVSPSADVRAASFACQRDLSGASTELFADPALYAAVAGAAAAASPATAADRKLLELSLAAAKRSGGALPAGRRSEYVALQKQLAHLRQSFAANLNNDTSSIVITGAQAASLPDAFTAALSRNQAGELVVPVNESTSPTFMQNQADPAARRAFYLAYARRGGAQNVQLLEQALAIRDRLAHLLGYPTWAAYVTADRMAGSPQRVEAFLRDLDAALLPAARAQRAELAALKGAPLDEWDVAFEQNALRKRSYALDNLAVAQYFPAGHTVDAVLGIYERLLGVSFAKAPELPRWHDDVLAYRVSDAAGGAPLGVFYLDLYPRPGKYNHFATFAIVPRRTLAGGSVRAPVAAIVGNWPAPAPGQPALLSHDDVRTFFHEFGHAMADMLAATPYATLNRNFRWDFVEAPSQMLENWIWDPAVLKQISSNAQTGEPLPDELIAKLLAARHVDEAYGVVRQIALATIDMRYHTAGPSVDTTALWWRTVRETSPSSVVEGTYPQAGFGHLMGGYDAGYYGYLWSKVYAQDMFSAFERAGLSDPAVGRRYREDILAPARSEEPDAEVSRFLGRPMRPDAFYRELGIAPPAAATRK